MTFDAQIANRLNEMGIPDEPEMRKQLPPVLNGELILLSWRHGEKITCMTTKGHRLARQVFLDLFTGP